MKNFPKWLPGLLLSLGITILVMILYFFDVFNNAENLTGDMRFKIRGTKKVSSPVVFVAIDENSIASIGRWPWPRSIIAELLNRITIGSPKVIGLNILFSEPDMNQGLVELKSLKEKFDSDFIKKRTVYSRNKVLVDEFLNIIEESEIVLDNDRALSDTLKSVNNAILPMFFDLSKPSGPEMAVEMPELLEKNCIINSDKPEKASAVLKGYICVMPHEMFSTAAIGIGHINDVNDSDGVVRKMYPVISYGGKIFPSFEVQLLRLYNELSLPDLHYFPGKELKLGNVTVPLEKDSSLTINFRSTPQTTKCISVYEIFGEQFKPEIFKDKIVIIGHRASGIATLISTPLSTTVTGVERIVEAINTIANKDFIYKTTKMQDILLLLVIGIIMGIFITHFKPLGGVIFTGIFFLVYVAVNYFLFAKYSISAKIVYPSVLIFFCDLSLVLYKYATEEKEKKWIKGAFSTYIPASVVDKLMDNPEAMSLGGEHREMTVFFSDIAGFTTISESLSPKELVHFINEYLDSMTKIIFKHEGTLDKYIGDAIMAFWNAPADQADHALRGCFAALECMQELKILQHKWAGEGKAPFNIRIGLNTGPMLVGNMGSSIRMNYTIMGDAVNLGSRLEAANKEYGTNIMMSEFTKVLVEKEIECRELDLLRVKGKNKPIGVYEVTGLKGSLIPAKTKVVEFYKNGLKCYKIREWQDAINFFTEALNILPDDGPSKTYLGRCNEFMKNPPEPDWDGVWKLKTK